MAEVDEKASPKANWLLREQKQARKAHKAFTSKEKKKPKAKAKAKRTPWCSSKGHPKLDDESDPSDSLDDLDESSQSLILLQPPLPALIMSPRTR